MYVEYASILISVIQRPLYLKHPNYTLFLSSQTGKTQDTDVNTSI